MHVRFSLRVRMGLLASLRVYASAWALVYAYAYTCMFVFVFIYVCLYPQVSADEKLYTYKIMHVSMNVHMHARM